MHALTQQITTELDVLYGLYEMAMDLSKRIQPDDEELTGRLLDARKKILNHTAESSAQLVTLLKSFQGEKWIPSNEKALVEEKRNLVQDLGLKMQATDNQMVRQLLAKMQSVRTELADQTERKNGIKAYIQTSRPMLQVQ
jgi:SMC interacting uncharacterized protein involved in chromosome segregation